MHDKNCARRNFFFSYFLLFFLLFGSAFSKRRNIMFGKMTMTTNHIYVMANKHFCFTNSNDSAFTCMYTLKTKVFNRLRIINNFCFLFQIYFFCFGNKKKRLETKGEEKWRKKNTFRLIGFRQNRHGFILFYRHTCRCVQVCMCQWLDERHDFIFGIIWTVQVIANRCLQLIPSKSIWVMVEDISLNVQSIWS